MVANIVKAMEENQVSRLIYVTGLGLYHEVPGEFGRWVEESIGSDIMDDTRRAAKIIEESTVNYTILRAAYMTNNPEIDYELTEKEFYKGTIISRVSIADLINCIIKNRLYTVMLVQAFQSQEQTAIDYVLKKIAQTYGKKVCAVLFVSFQIILSMEYSPPAGERREL